MKTILYTTDCTKKSGSALIYAYRLSNALKAQLHVLHVYDLEPIVTTSVRARGSLERNFAGEQTTLLEQYCTQQLKKEFGQPVLHCHAVKHESVSQAVLNTAEKISADLVLVGQKNPRSIRGLFTEHIANTLMRKLSCPLLILPDDVVYQGLSTLLYATDFEESDLYALDFVARLAEPFGAQIDIIHIPRKNETYHQRKMEWFRDMIRLRIPYPEIYFASRKAEDVETGIRQFIDKNRPELLGMMERQRRTYVETLFHKDLVQTMEDEVAVPLLVFNKRQLKLKFSREAQDTDVLSYA
jgi:nucleotide-binding universal stress UspA family protein